MELAGSTKLTTGLRVICWGWAGSDLEVGEVRLGAVVAGASGAPDKALGRSWRVMDWVRGCRQEVGGCRQLLVLVLNERFQEAQ